MRPSGLVRSLMVCAVALSLVAGARTPVLACGHCLEDKIAATYDYAVLTRAARGGHVVVFTEIHGPAAGAGPLLKAFIARALSAIPGMDAGTVRVSLDPPAASFACDPARRSPDAMIAAGNRRLAAKGLRLTVIKIDPGQRSTAAAHASGCASARSIRRSGTNQITATVR